MLGKTFSDLVDICFCVVELYRDFVSKLIRIIVKYARNFLQGSTYPVGCVWSLTSWDNHLDNSFCGTDSLYRQKQEHDTQNANNNKMFSPYYHDSPEHLLLACV